MADVAYQFTPGLQQQFRRSLAGQTAQLPANASEALQVLSLHLPAFLGGTPIAPDALLRPRLGGVRPDLAVQAQTTGVPAAGPSPVSASSTSTGASAGAPIGSVSTAPSLGSPGAAGQAWGPSVPSSTPFQPSGAASATGGPQAPTWGQPGPTIDFAQGPQVPGPSGGGDLLNLLTTLFGTGGGSEGGRPSGFGGDQPLPSTR